MRAGRIFTAFAVLGVSSALAVPVQAETRYEQALQYALESLTSGIPATSRIGEATITVKPTRTWKSVSGHYCRQYELTITEADAAPERNEGIRCRDGDGIWKQVKGN